ncbi:hypothetical protein BDW02DRAFT_596646 [Decorospora gaudefroyi]|uniref:G domain-containing protein n=1 Tax=Decorospora gaudefroyi TaxID=184978 RepID=A0A6A5KK94_9PLEO|nr:hypothetical protein BDW02DRAFT_596646 [Decorospora gaudefroyi]
MGNLSGSAGHIYTIFAAFCIITVVGVSDRGRGKHDINHGQTFLGQNERIIIHDSRGFESGEQDTFDEVVNFLSEKRLQPKLADQIHCIWYCISCESDARVLQASEEKFFRDLDNLVGCIPVVVVFTKYDELVSREYSKWYQKNRKKMQRNQISEAEMYNTIRVASENAFANTYEEEWARAINGIRIASQRVANPQDMGEDNDISQICEGYIGVEKLTKLTLQSLQNHDIKNLWVTAQNNSAELNSQQSITKAMELFRTNQAWNAVPIIPVVSAVAFWHAFSECFFKISPIWNVVDYEHLLEKRSTRTQFISAIFDESAWSFLAWRSADVFSIVSAPHTAAILARVVAGITLIHDELFVLQKSKTGRNQEVTSLTVEEMKSVLSKFRKMLLEGEDW